MTNPILTDGLLGVIALPIATWSGTTNGPALDAWANGGEYRSAMLTFFGNIDAADTATLIVQESDDGSTGWTSISGASFAINESNADGKMLMANVRLSGTKRFIRARIASVVNTPSGNAGWILGDSKEKPPSQVESLMFSV